MVKITISVGGTPIEMTVEEARAVRDQLDALFGRSVVNYGPLSQIGPWRVDPCPPLKWPYEVTCGEAYGN